MSFNDLGEFISLSGTNGRAGADNPTVSRDLEITEITDRIVKSPDSSNRALLFENVEGFSIPVVTNLFGTESRMSAALGVRVWKSSTSGFPSSLT